METLIIAFGHKARNGKDTAVNAILEKYKNDYDIIRVAFADALKREVNEEIEKMVAVGFTPSNAMKSICEQHGIEYDPTPDMTDPLCPYGKQRKLLQWWGTEYRRTEDRWYWVKKTRDFLNERKPQIALISDMRFPNEMLWVKNLNGKTVKVERLGFIDPLASADSHVSESSLDEAEYHYTMQVPDGDVNELKKDAIFVFDHIISSMQMPDLSSAWAELEMKPVPADSPILTTLVTG